MKTTIEREVQLLKKEIRAMRGELNNLVRKYDREIVLTPSQAARILSLKVSELEQLDIPRYIKGNRVYYFKSEVIEFIRD